MTALIDLIERRQWVAWRNELRDGKQTKVPYCAASRLAESDKPDTWMPHDQAVPVAQAIVNGTGGGVGLMLGRCGDLWLAGADFDTCRNPETGVIEPWAREPIDRFGSYAEISPSRTGIKVFFTIDPADIEPLRTMMRTQHGRQFKRANGTEHPPAIELYTSNRYFCVTWQPLDGPDELRTVPLNDLKWLLEQAGPAFAGKDKDGRGGGSDSSRSGAAYRLGVRMRREGASLEEFIAALQADPQLAAWYREKGEANDARELLRIWEKTEAGGISLDDFWAFMPRHNYVHAPSRETWPGSSVNARLSPVGIRRRPRATVAGRQGKPEDPAADRLAR